MADHRLHYKFQNSIEIRMCCHKDSVRGTDENRGARNRHECVGSTHPQQGTAIMNTQSSKHCFCSQMC